MKNVFKKTGLAAAAAVSVTVMAASAASAATFDFVAMADVSSDANYIGGTELNWGDTSFSGGLTIGGITLNASGSNVNGTFADAFFDKNSAGLGVCSTASVALGSGCATGIGTNTGDDNVSGMAGGETLTLDFGQVVDLSGLSFNSGNHPPLTGSLGLNGGTLTLVNGAVTSGANLLSGSSIFNFVYTGDEFYLATATANLSAVPIPAGAALLLTGLGAFGAIGRRRKRATA